MSAYLLDTNIVSHIIKGDQPDILRRLADLPMEDVVISAVTEDELFYGLAKDSRERLIKDLLNRPAL